MKEVAITTTAGGDTTITIVGEDMITIIIEGEEAGMEMGDPITATIDIIRRVIPLGRTMAVRIIISHTTEDPPGRISS